jgi:hypothetical protein
MIKDSVSGKKARQPASSIEPMMRRLFPGFESQTIWYFTNKSSVSYRMPVKTGIHKELRILDSGSR